MKKVFVALGLLLLVSACGGMTYQEALQEYRYGAKAEPEDYIGQGYGNWYASQNSQNEANSLALNDCSKRYNECVLTFEGNTYIYKTQTQRNEIVLSEALVSATGKAKTECLDLGFNEGTNDYADCNLKLSTLYKEEAHEQQKILIAQQQAKAAKRQAAAAEAQARATEQQAYEARRRNSQAQIERGMKMLSGGCTLGIDC